VAGFGCVKATQEAGGGVKRERSVWKVGMSLPVYYYYHHQAVKPERDVLR